MVDYYLSNTLSLFRFVYVFGCFVLLCKEPLGCLCSVLYVGKGGSGVKHLLRPLLGRLHTKVLSYWYS